MRGSQRFFVFLATFGGVMFAAVSADAHGTPIHVDVAGDKLVVSGGVVDTNGFAPMIFVEDDEDGIPFGEVTLSGFGHSIIWQIPGYEVFGMAENSGLYLDVISRPFAHATPVENRVLWYSDTVTTKVQTTPAANPLQIRKDTSTFVTLSPTDGTDLPPLKIAAPLASDIGVHKHLVAYALKDETEPPAGAYGFFAQLKSDMYQPSDPFLVVLNKDVFDYEQMVPAARAINAAAFLPGDYNHDERVDAADYVVWRKTLGSSTQLAADGSYNDQVDQVDYGVWRKSFGLMSVASGLSSNQAPEPSGDVLVAAALLAVGLARRRMTTASHARAAKP